MNNAKRMANFTSSNIYKLTKRDKSGKKFGAPAFTYIEEKQIESRMKRCLDTGGYSQAMAWGNFMEMIVFNKLGTDYVITSLDTDVHPKIKRWAGSKDYHKVKNGKIYCIGDIKCYQPKKFAQYTDVILKQDVELLKSTHPEEYWQLVSNAIINGVNYAEAITFMPYESDMDEIREIAAGWDGAEQWKYRFIYEQTNSELPVLPDDGYYKSINKFEFKVPTEDKVFLTKCVMDAIKELEKTNTTI